MIDGIERYYQVIGDSVASRLPESWELVSVDAIFFPNHISYSAEYSDASGEPKSFATSVDAENAFEQIRELFRRSGKPVWCRAHFEMRSNGKFKMNFSYDDCDEEGFAKFDEDAEVKRMAELRQRFT